MKPFTVAALAMFALSAPAMAADTTPPAGGPMNAVRQACADDIKQYCADVEAGGGRVGQCLRAHEDKLSAACTQARADARSHMQHKSGG